MNIEKANIIIAEYMDIKWYATCKKTGGVFYKKPTEEFNQIWNHNEIINIDTLLRYDNSLDSLVLVWEKLNVIVTHIEGDYVEISSFRNHPHKAEVFLHKGENIYEAACIATAKAIEALGL